MTSDEIEALIASVAAGDKTISSDGKSLTSHDLKDLLALLQHQQGVEASEARVPGMGMRFTKLVPPGCG